MFNSVFFPSSGGVLTRNSTLEATNMKA